MRQRTHRVVIGSLLVVALAYSGAAGLSGAGARVWHVPTDFPTIQAAVDAAAEGDTIFVAPGVYTENVVVSTSHLTLRGAGPVSPVERPGDSATENVVLDGTGVGGLGIGIHVLGTAAVPVTDVQVSNFEVRNYERGISLEETTNGRVSHNYVHDNFDKIAPLVLGDGYGIELNVASSSDVSHNLVCNNGFGGIRFGGTAGSVDNWVHHNRVFENGAAALNLQGVGIMLTGPSNDNRVEYNEIIGNLGRGILASRPAGTVAISGNLLAHNRAHGNQRAGIAIMGSARGNTVLYNDARDNNLSGLGPCFRCNLFDFSIGGLGGNLFDKNLGTFNGTDACRP